MSTTEMKLQGFGFSFNDSNRFFLKKQHSFMIMKIDRFKVLNLFNKSKKQRQKAAVNLKKPMIKKVYYIALIRLDKRDNFLDAVFLCRTPFETPR